jgi:hypothetical protein
VGGGVDIIQQLRWQGTLYGEHGEGVARCPPGVWRPFLGQGEAFRMRDKYPGGYETTHSKGGLDNNPGVAETAPHRTISHARGSTRTRNTLTHQRENM